LRQRSFLVQPFIVSLLVGPWAIWTSGLAFSGLPSTHGELNANRAWYFVQETFRIFPPGLMAVVILGLIALLVSRTIWHQDLLILGVLGIGHWAFLILSPVVPEQRYLLVPAAILLIFAFSGWCGALERFTSLPDYPTYAVSALAAILTLGFVISHFGRYPAPPQYPIREAVRFVVEHPEWASQPVVVSPNLEGPMIAEFVAQDTHRPGYHLQRPGKTLIHADWLGRDYSSTFTTSEEMMDYFRGHPVGLMVWNEPAEATRRPHERTMSEMLQRNPSWWHKVASFASPGGDALALTIYEYTRPLGGGPQ